MHTYVYIFINRYCLAKHILMPIYTKIISYIHKLLSYQFFFKSISYSISYLYGKRGRRDKIEKD